MKKGKITWWWAWSSSRAHWISDWSTWARYSSALDLVAKALAKRREGAIVVVAVSLRRTERAMWKVLEEDDAMAVRRASWGSTAEETRRSIAYMAISVCVLNREGDSRRRAKGLSVRVLGESRVWVYRIYISVTFY